MEIIYFDGFTAGNVFSYGALNAFFNRMYTCLGNAYKLDFSKIIIDGAVARVMLDAKQEEKVQYIEVTITSEEMYRFLCATVFSLGIDNAKKTDGFLQINVLGYVIKVTLSYTAVPYVVLHGIAFRNKNNF